MSRRTVLPQAVSFIGLAVTSSVLGACVGSVGAPAGEESTGGGGGSSSREDRNRPAGLGDPAPAATIRRLTRTEYNFTILDLIGDTSNPGDALARDGAAKVFDNSAAGLNLDDTKLEKYDAVAEQIIENALALTSKTRVNLLRCSLASGGRECARKSIELFARRAWRRPLTDEDRASLLATLDEASKLGGIEDGAKVVFRSILVSPHFLFRAEPDPPGATGSRRVSPHELATRLSYLIYSSMPDQELADLADSGVLADAGVYAGQIARMLADPKAARLAGNFGAQWLMTRAILDPNQAAPDPKAYPKFDAPLRQAMQQETEKLFEAFATEDRNVADMIDADFTFANARLAQHYGIPGVVSKTAPVKVMLAGTHRVGVLTNGGMLTTMSRPTGTSYTRRGKYILNRLLCTELGQPPKDADAALNAQHLPLNATPKERAAAVLDTRSDCKSCHSRMDPLGFGLEHFDPVGAWRTSYGGGATIDATGEVVMGMGGAAFNGAEGLAAAIKQDSRYTRCLAQQLYTFALGREPTDAIDQKIIDGLDGSYRNQGGRMRALVTELARSEAFLSRMVSE